MIYQTMQVMGVAWRGNVRPVEHFPDPSVDWPEAAHLRRHPFSGWQTHPDYARDRQELQAVFSVLRPFGDLNERRLRTLFTLARFVCERDWPGNFVACGINDSGVTALLSYIIKKYSRRPRKVFCLATTDVTPPDPTINKLSAACQQFGAAEHVVVIPATDAQPLQSNLPAIGEIALVHLGNEAYDVTRNVLSVLYDAATSPGFLQFDDLGPVAGGRQAVQEFEQQRSLRLPLHAIDDAAAWMRKDRVGP
jgi:hypothetical protein